MATAPVHENGPQVHLFDRDAETLRHPREMYRKLRDDEPVTRIPDMGVVVSTRADVEEVLRHPEVFSSAMGGADLKNIRPLIPLQIDPPEHREFRRLEREPNDGLLCRLLDAEVDGDRLTREDILDVCFLSLLAGLDTVAGSLDCMLSPERYWPDLCKALGQPEMANDPRFVDMAARRANAQACVEWLDELFAERSYDEWCRVLADFEGERAPSRYVHDVDEDPQVQANGYLGEIDLENGHAVPMVTTPVQFDERPGRSTRAPEHAEHTETVLLELGFSWEDLAGLKDAGGIR